MEIYKLASEKRDVAAKAKDIRKKGFVPAVVYGHHLDPINIQISEAEVAKFLKTNSIGSKVLLLVGKEEHLSILKESQREPVSYKIMHMDFQALTTGEKIKVTVPIIFKNRDSVGSDKVLQEQMSEIEISTLPKFLIDHVSIDVAEYDLGDSVLVSDLDVSKDKNIEVLSPQESQVFVISHAAKFKEETPADEEQIETAADEAETPEE